MSDKILNEVSRVGLNSNSDHVLSNKFRAVTKGRWDNLEWQKGDVGHHTAAFKDRHGYKSVYIRFKGAKTAKLIPDTIFRRFFEVTGTDESGADEKKWRPTNLGGSSVKVKQRQHKSQFTKGELKKEIKKSIGSEQKESTENKEMDDYLITEEGDVLSIFNNNNTYELRKHITENTFFVLHRETIEEGKEPAWATEFKQKQKGTFTVTTTGPHGTQKKSFSDSKAAQSHASRMRGVDDNVDVSVKRGDIAARAKGDKKALNNEVEPIDELYDTTLKSYIDKKMNLPGKGNIERFRKTGKVPVGVWRAVRHLKRNKDARSKRGHAFVGYYDKTDPDSIASYKDAKKKHMKNFNRGYNASPQDEAVNPALLARLAAKKPPASTTPAAKPSGASSEKPQTADAAAKEVVGAPRVTKAQYDAKQAAKAAAKAAELMKSGSLKKGDGPIIPSGSGNTQKVDPKSGVGADKMMKARVSQKRGNLVQDETIPDETMETVDEGSNSLRKIDLSTAKGQYNMSRRMERFSDPVSRAARTAKEIIRKRGGIVPVVGNPVDKDEVKRETRYKKLGSNKATKSPGERYPHAKTSYVPPNN